MCPELRQSCPGQVCACSHRTHGTEIWDTSLRNLGFGTATAWGPLTQQGLAAHCPGHCALTRGYSSWALSCYAPNTNINTRRVQQALWQTLRSHRPSPTSEGKTSGHGEHGMTKGPARDGREELLTARTTACCPASCIPCARPWDLQGPFPHNLVFVGAFPSHNPKLFYCLSARL